MACSSGTASLSIVQRLVEADPSAVQARNFHGLHPLDLAMRWVARNTNDEVIDYLQDCQHGRVERSAERLFDGGLLPDDDDDDNDRQYGKQQKRGGGGDNGKKQPKNEKEQDEPLQQKPAPKKEPASLDVHKKEGQQKKPPKDVGGKEARGSKSTTALPVAKSRKNVKSITQSVSSDKKKKRRIETI